MGRPPKRVLCVCSREDGGGRQEQLNFLQESGLMPRGATETGSASRGVSGRPSVHPTESAAAPRLADTGAAHLHKPQWQPHALPAPGSQLLPRRCHCSRGSGTCLGDASEPLGHFGAAPTPANPHPRVVFAMTEGQQVPGEQQQEGWACGATSLPGTAQVPK